jgi:hypothetical protein
MSLIEICCPNCKHELKVGQLFDYPVVVDYTLEPNRINFVNRNGQIIGSFFMSDIPGHPPSPPGTAKKE